MSSRTHKFRRVAARLGTESRRLQQIAQALRDANLPIVGKDIDELALQCGCLAISLSHVADTVRDPRGAVTESDYQGEQQLATGRDCHGRITPGR
jgi:signal recognition particle subunit SEC65